MADKVNKGTTGTRRPSAGTGQSPPKNEYEIWSEFNDTMAKLVAELATRFKDQVVGTKPLKVEYTIGEFMLDQLANSTKLVQSYLSAARNK